MTVLLVAGLFAFRSQQEKNSPESEKIAGRAKEMIEFLSKEDYGSAGKHFDPTMKKEAPPAMLKKIWDGLRSQVGPFKGIKSSRVETSRTYDFVYVACEFEKQTLDARVTFNKSGEIAGLNFVPHLKSKEYRTPPYARPELFEEREVEVGSGEWVLPGTLSIPRGTGPFPAVVLVHGSGPNDRDETIGPNKPFKDLAWGLASRGIAVLRYDKRTKVYGPKIVMDKALATSLTVREETVDDALAAVSLLRKTEGIDSSKIFILGHSLGGMLIPRMAAMDNKAAGFIIMAGLTRPLEETILEQTRYLSSLQGALSEANKKNLEEMEKAVARIKALDESGDIPDERLLGAYPGYWLDLCNYDPAEEAKKVDRPLLILQGARDYQVTTKDFENWKKALEGRRNVEFKLYPKCNHLFIEGEGLITPNEYLYTSGHVAEFVIDDVAGWIMAVKKGTGPFLDE